MRCAIILTKSNSAVGAVKSLPHLSWRDLLNYILCQEDISLLVQDRCIPDCHQGLENAAELGRSPSELNCIAESNCANEPVRMGWAAQATPQTRTRGSKETMDVPVVVRRGE